VYIFLVIIICSLSFFFLKNDRCFLSYFISYFISRKFLFSLVFLFFNEVKNFTVQGGSQMNFFKKTKVEIINASSGSQNKSCKKWCKCMIVRMYAIFFIFDIIDYFCLTLAFRKRCISVLRTYEHIYEILWWFMRMYVWNA